MLWKKSKEENKKHPKKSAKETKAEK